MTEKSLPPTSRPENVPQPPPDASGSPGQRSLWIEFVAIVAVAAVVFMYYGIRRILGAFIVAAFPNPQVGATILLVVVVAIGVILYVIANKHGRRAD